MDKTEGKRNNPVLGMKRTKQLNKLLPLLQPRSVHSHISNYETEDLIR